MKLSISILVPLVIIGAVLLGGLFILPGMNLPQDKLSEEVDVQIEKAQRLLNEYNAAAPRMEQAFASATTQPENIDGEKWSAAMALEGDQNPLAAYKERVDADGRGLQQLSSRITELGGDERPRQGTPDATRAYQTVETQLKSNGALLDEALSVLGQVKSVSAGEGDEEASGGKHPIATRLEAVLLHHKADLLRHRAALIRSQAERERRNFRQIVAACQDLNEEVSAQKALLAAGTAPGKTKDAPAAKTNRFAVPDTAKKKPAKEKPANKGWLFSGLVSKVKPKQAEPAAPEPAPEPVAAQPAPSEPAEPASEPEAQPTEAAETVPSLAERLAAAEKHRDEVKSHLDALQAKADQLTKQGETLNAQIAAAQKQASAAEIQMIEAERKGIKKSDAKSMQGFADDYRKLSEENRKAAGEAVALQQGAVTNAKPATDDPDEILKAPLVPVDPAKPMESQRGLVAIEGDLATTKGEIETNRKLLTEIEHQIAALTARRTGVEDRIKKLQTEEQTLANQAAKVAQVVMTDVARAEQLEQEAIQVVDKGLTAATRAQSAAGDYQRKMQQFVRSENPVETPERKLSDMANDQFAAAGAALTQGDLEFLKARILVQQAEDLKRHGEMLQTMQSLGIATALDPKQLPEGVAIDSVLPCATNPAEVAKSIDPANKESLLVKAAEAGHASLDAYTKAASQLKDLWAVHTSIAAVHNLLADLPKVANDTEDHAALARQTYARAIQGRENAPGYATFHRIAEGLKQQAAD